MTTNCESPDCKNSATQILSVGSLGRVVTLCPAHVAMATGPLDANLTPYQLTGVEHSFSAEQSLMQTVDTLDNEKEDLVDQIEDARRENVRLQELLISRLTQQNVDLRAELDAVKAAAPLVVAGDGPLTPRDHG
jgi:hypothetical protein